MSGQIVALTFDAELTQNNFVYCFFRKVTEWIRNVSYIAKQLGMSFPLNTPTCLQGNVGSQRTAEILQENRDEEHPFLVLTNTKVWWINTWEKGAIHVFTFGQFIT